MYYTHTQIHKHTQRSVGNSDSKLNFLWTPQTSSHTDTQPHTHTHTHTATRTVLRVSQLLAGHASVHCAPEVVTHRTPDLVETHLHTTFELCGAFNQSDVSFVAGYEEGEGGGEGRSDFDFKSTGSNILLYI